MTIRELIEKLEELDGDKKVRMLSDDGKGNEMLSEIETILEDDCLLTDEDTFVTLIYGARVA